MGIRTQEQEALLTAYTADTAYNTAYQMLYANIQFDSESEQVRQQTILLTTPTYYTGQAITVANLAIAAAQSGTPTLLVDANLQDTSSLHDYFEASDNPGLKNWLKGQTQPEETISSFLSKTPIPGLRLLGAGTLSLQPQEADRLLSANLPGILTALRHYLEETETKPGLIIFNGPPVLESIVTSRISAHVDRTFLFIANGQTTRTQARRAQEQLQRAHTKLAGIIMVDA